MILRSRISREILKEFEGGHMVRPFHFPQTDENAEIPVAVAARR